MNPIVQHPNDRLRVVCAPVQLEKLDQYKLIVNAMISGAEAWEKIRTTESCAALAAPQIGSDMRIVIVRTKNGKWDVYYNPSIIQHSLGTNNQSEGCLSLTGHYAQVKRYNAVEVQAWNRNGTRQIIKAQGYAAKMWQHEIDHLDGVLFIDHVTEGQPNG